MQPHNSRSWMGPFKFIRRQIIQGGMHSALIVKPDILQYIHDGFLPWICSTISPKYIQPVMKFVFLRAEIYRRLLSDSGSPRTPLSLANRYYCLRGSGL